MIASPTAINISPSLSHSTHTLLLALPTTNPQLSTQHMAYSTKVYVTVCATVSFLGLLFFLFPAQVLYWTGEVARRTLAAIYLLTVVSLLVSLGNDARKGLVRLCSRRTGPQAAVGPLTLEDGTAESEAELIPNSTTPAAESEATVLGKLFPFTRQGIPGKLLSLIFFTYLLARHLMLSVSPESTVGENVRAVVLYLVNGLHGVFALCVIVLGVKQSKAVSGDEVEAIAPEAAEGVMGKDAKELLVEAEAEAL
ncbi:hypothetical protein DFH06DRAFT_1341023 [Mycena polygramma]|nr:hypothetical protein DFH06DRAFT_1341023 [Mycena polygramma]